MPQVGCLHVRFYPILRQGRWQCPASRPSPSEPRQDQGDFDGQSCFSLNLCHLPPALMGGPFGPFALPPVPGAPAWLTCLFLPGIPTPTLSQALLAVLGYSPSPPAGSFYNLFFIYEVGILHLSSRMLFLSHSA